MGDLSRERERDHTLPGGQWMIQRNDLDCIELGIHFTRWGLLRMRKENHTIFKRWHVWRLDDVPHWDWYSLSPRQLNLITKCTKECVDACGASASLLLKHLKDYKPKSISRASGQHKIDHITLFAHSWQNILRNLSKFCRNGALAFFAILQELKWIQYWNVS